VAATVSSAISKIFPAMYEPHVGCPSINENQHRRTFLTSRKKAQKAQSGKSFAPFVLLSVKVLFSCVNIFSAARSGVAQI
jgi:hypothetical protein